MNPSIRPREREAILQSLRAGVVPSIGLQHIQVGRKAEVAAVLNDLALVEESGASVRFIIGRFGAGKSFFLNLARMVALERRFVVVQADITPDRRLHASGGQARGLFAELMQNMAVRSQPTGGALPVVVERWVSDVNHEVQLAGGTDAEVARRIHERLQPLHDMVGGFDFATILTRYFEGFQQSNAVLMESALRWLRAQYTTRTDARADLGVRAIIDDEVIYEYLKLLAAFVRLAGHAGLLVNLDEMGVLSHRLNHQQARNANYEVILRIVNDCLQGNTSGIGFLFSGTDTFLDDQRRGLASYEALATRLAENRFAANGLADFSGPIIRLANLSVEDLYVLLHRIRDVFARGDSSAYLVPDEGITAFITYCSQTLGAEFFRTPRDAVKGFVGLLSVLEQNADADWRALLETTTLEQTSDPDLSGPPDDDQTANGDLATFRL